MELKFRYKKAYIERTELGYPIGYVNSDRRSQCDDCTKCVWYKFKFENYWAINIHDGVIRFVKIRIRRYGDR